MGFCFGPLSRRSLGLRMGQGLSCRASAQHALQVASAYGFRASREAVEPRFSSLPRSAVALVEFGWAGIRTLGAGQGTHAFQACAIDHSATHPNNECYHALRSTLNPHLA